MDSSITGAVFSPAEHAPTGGSNPATRRYKGVRLRKWGSWVAEVRFPNSRERLWLGSYPTVEQAARAFDAAVYCLRGPGAEFNFPDQLPEIPNAGGLMSREEIRKVALQFAQSRPRQIGEGGSGEMTTMRAAVTVDGAGERPGTTTAESLTCEEIPTGLNYSTGVREDDKAWAATFSCDDIYSISPLWNFEM
ncbi:ethylene-responsive transcription factor [Canna indica]|uniref:Ethylene-responsive transcription factor n=1 Tax=Canna indica TaxID=4628 RepID=A0AAQ3KC71_9LILI|nr:ethylene-responsive transcription factor [Canna indica]